MSSSLKLVELFSYIFPLNWKVEKKTDTTFLVRDGNIDRTSGYSIELSESSTSLSARLSFETYANELQQLVRSNIYKKQAELIALREAFPKFTFKLVETRLDYSFELNFGQAHQLEIQLEKTIDCEDSEKEQFLDIIFFLLMTIFPYEAEGEIEGESRDSKSIRYERSKKNKSICLAVHGYKCKACKMVFEEQYGPIARNFIEVHHLYPVSSAGVASLDPINDLVPLCPNCHSVAHLQSPPYSIEEIKQMRSKSW
jgi:predicted HNH restriction endonuclease